MPDGPAPIVPDSVLRRIDAAFASTPAVAVVPGTGAAAPLGGGKTSVAIAYARRRGGPFPGGRFVVPAEPDDPTASLAELGRWLGLSAALSDADRAEQVRRLLRDGPPALLVLDGVTADGWDDGRLLGRLPGGSVRVLVTTRLRQPAGATAVPVRPLGPADAARLARRWGLDAADLPDRLDRWPDAIALAAMAAQRSSPAAALVAAAPRRPAVLRLTTAPPDPTPTDAVADLLYARLDPVERRVVDYAALLPPLRTPRRWLVDAVGRERTGLPRQAGLRRSSAAADAVDRLAVLGLLRPGPAGTATAVLHGAFARRRADVLAARPGPGGPALERHRPAGSRPRPCSRPAVRPVGRPGRGGRPDQRVGRPAAGRRPAGRGDVGRQLRQRTAEKARPPLRVAGEPASVRHVRLVRRPGPAADAAARLHPAEPGDGEADTGDLAGALRTVDRGIEMAAGVLRPDDSSRASLHQHRGGYLSRAGIHAAAGQAMWVAIAVRRTQVPADNLGIVGFYADAAVLHRRAGRAPQVSYRPSRPYGSAGHIAGRTTRCWRCTGHCSPCA